jgi:hypothetical protein
VAWTAVAAEAVVVEEEAEAEVAGRSVSATARLAVIVM